MATKRTVVGMFLALMLGLTGCGGSAPSAKSATASEAPPATQGLQPPAPSAEFRAASAEPSAAPKDAAKADRSESRPGLGTEWGETRASRVHDVTFVRDSSRPFATAMLHYNDRKGVDALANLHGSRDSRRDVAAANGAITIAIKDESGNALEAIRAGDRTLVVGRAGQRYSIVLTNHTGHRFESVVTVDGLDVVNGKAGSFDHRGYVLNPFATVEIDGFRQSEKAVAAFRFGSVAESYAAQTGQPRNVGVIGAAFFSERGDSFVDPEDTRLRDTASPFPADPRFAQPPRR